ncbi:MAG TPA: NRDE family protein [Stellaceae bacterium]|jgi:hypothetical protein|nr:NRDE family protein [Stellaceae bacterium]
MCTIVVARRPGHAWPLVVGANRDEMIDRPWAAPGRHWPERPEVVAGLDHVAGGSWMGVNEHGLTAAILNRKGTLGPATGKRSRGEIVLEALDHVDAADAAAALVHLDPEAYRPFNLVVADNRDAFWLAHTGTGPIVVEKLPEGISMLAERDLNDLANPRIGRYLSRFRAVRMPDPDADDWREWAELLTDRQGDSAHGEEGSLAFLRASGFGTVSHSLLALPAVGRDVPPVWRFAKASEAEVEWQEIPLAG